MPFNREQLLKLHHDMCEEARKIMEQKNHDYSGATGQDPFANFKRCEALGICSTEQGVLVRLADKLSRLSTFVSAGELKVRDESVRDTLHDLINYAILFYGVILESGEKKYYLEDTIALDMSGWGMGSDGEVRNRQGDIVSNKERAVFLSYKTQGALYDADAKRRSDQERDTRDQEFLDRDKPPLASRPRKS